MASEMERNAGSPLRVGFRKITDERHVLEVTRADGRTESVECETRSYFVHDLLHYAVESEARLQGGFWGNLAAGKTLAQMNDRNARTGTATPPLGAGMSDVAGEMGAIERIVGALHQTTKGRSSREIVGGVRRYYESIGEEAPAWLTEALVDAVQARMRKLQGAWRATPRGGRLELSFPPDDY
jgi:hypothetical protein